MAPRSIIQIAYILFCIATITFNTIGIMEYMTWSKAFVVPLALLLYLQHSTWRITYLKASIFLCCFLGDTYRLIMPYNYETGQVICFLTAYLLLLYYLFPQFISENIRQKKHMFIVTATIICLTALAYFILNLNFEKLETNYYILLFYSLILSLLICVSIVEYNRKPDAVSVNLLMLTMFFVFSDCFYIINKFYLPFSLLNFIQITTQVFSYYFLIHLFLDQKRLEDPLDND